MKYQVITVDIDSLRSNEHKHHKKDGWFKVYYYKDNKRTEAKVSKAKECSSFKCFRKDTFYKCQSLSTNDLLFDYYKIKKRNVKGDAFSKKKERGKRTHKITPRDFQIKVEKGNFVLEF